MNRLVWNLCFSALLAAWIGGVAPGWSAPLAVGVPAAPVPDSPDFATLVLRDPWDMNQYSDVSQYLNESGQRSLVRNPSVADGIFTGQSVGDVNSGNAYFFPLFPGYETAMFIGKIGHRYPIDAATYHCLYMAMKVDSGAANAFGPDKFRVFWFADDRLTNSPWGVSTGITLYPEAGSAAPTPSYRLYTINLATVAHSFVDWTSRATWQGIRTDPTINAGVNFAIDWVRLTTCAANPQTITWSPDSQITAMWLMAAGTNRFVRVATALSGSSGTGTPDLQGVPPGSYTVGLGTATTCCIQQGSTPLVVNQTPIADFVRPSFYSGQDFAALSGNPWDFNNGGDVDRSGNMAYTISNGVLDTTVPSGPPPAGVDAQFYLKLPQPIQPSLYRYLSLRMFTEWVAPWQNTPDGMIVRLVWGLQGTSGAPGNRCWLVSQDIPFDIGWQTYWIDLGDAFNGLPEATSQVDCPASTPVWTTSPLIRDLRIDPNENITVAADPITGGGPFHQKFDWIRLTAIDRVTRGMPFPIQVSLNRGVTSITYYYTTNRANPTQTRAQLYSPGPPSGSNRVFLPLIQGQFGGDDMGGLPATSTSFLWDTSQVGPNTYYICAQVQAGGNTATYCSEAPVIVQ